MERFSSLLEIQMMCEWRSEKAKTGMLTSQDSWMDGFPKFTQLLSR